MKRTMIITAMLVLALAIFPLAASAQSTAAPNEPTEGVNRGGYNIQQSIELGYRFTDITTPHNGGDDEAMFNTFVNLHQGPRLLEQTLSMRSLTNTGVLFDNLYISSFGWGGEPNNVARVRIEKNKFYNFSGSFRRDQNFFDYNLLANPLRVAGTDPAAFPNLNQSPHAFAVTRRMADMDLTLMPQSPITVRLGYSRNRANGPSFSTFHEGTDIMLDAPWNTTYQTWKFGVDMKFIPKTNISFDQFLDYGKNDTNYYMDPWGQYPFSNGATYDGTTYGNFGIVAPTAACFTNNNSYNPINCSGITSYSRLQRVRTSTPTSQLSLQSRPTERVEFMGRFSYSSTDLKSPFDESFTGLITRTRERAFTFGGDIHGKILNSSGDFGVTIHLTDKLSLSNTFRFLNTRQPAVWDMTENAKIIPVKSTYVNSSGATVACPTSGSIPNACRYGYADPGVWAGETAEPSDRFLGLNYKWNTTQLEFQPSRKFGARVGFRYGNRKVADSIIEDPEADLIGSARWDLTEHTGLVGFWVRPNNSLRANVEVELTSNGGTGLGPGTPFITRLSPTDQRHYRLRATWNPDKRLTMSGTANVLENKNDYPGIDYQGHNHNFGFTASVNANEKLSFEASYNYNDYMQNAWMCFVDTGYSPLPLGTLGPSTTTSPTAGCPSFGQTQRLGTGTNPANLYLYTKYNNNVNYFSGVVNFRPVKRVSAMLGYAVSKVDGGIPIFNSFLPLGPLNYTYHQPLASISFEMAKGWHFNTYWNYDQYNEGSFTGPTAPRYFHDNRAVLAVRYSF